MMKFLSKYSLKKTYTIIIIFLSLWVAIISFIVETKFQYENIEIEMNKRISQLTSEYQGVVTDYYQEKNFNKIQRFFSAISSQENFVAAWLNDEKKRILFADKNLYLDQNSVNILLKYEFEKNMQKSEFIDSNLFFSVSCKNVTLGISKGYISPNINGSLCLILEKKSLRIQSFLKNLTHSLYYWILFILVTAILFFLIYKSLIKRIQILTDKISLLGSGNYQVNFHLEGKDEISLLSQHLELMAAKLLAHENLLEKNAEEIRKYLDIIDKNVITSKTDSKGVITYASEAFAKISGYSKEELVGKRHNIIKHPNMPPEIYKLLWQTIKKGENWYGELKNRNKNGEAYWVSTSIQPIFDENGKIKEYTSIRHDITAQKRMEELSITDELTGIFNRRYFNKVLDIELKRSTRIYYPFCLVLFDIDFFKLFNDCFGHQAGDSILRKVGSFLVENFKRAGDFAFRVGGEEFALIAQANNLEQSLAVCNRLLKGIENLKIETPPNSKFKFLTISMGAIFHTGLNNRITFDELYSKADIELYKAKDNGRNQFSLI